MNDHFSKHLVDVETWLERELAGIRTGRANPALVEAISVNCYGGTTPLQQVASIHAPEPQALVIQPWDPSITKDIEKAIMTSGLGINPVADGKIIRLPFPPMTEDRRLELTKLVNDKAEQAKVRLRTFREETIKKLKLQQKAGDISEDGLNLDLKNIQSQMDESTERINQQLSKKTSELMAI